MEVSIKRATQILGVTRATVLRRVERGELEGRRAGEGRTDSWIITLPDPDEGGENKLQIANCKMKNNEENPNEQNENCKLQNEEVESSILEVVSPKHIKPMPKSPKSLKVNTESHKPEIESPKTASGDKAKEVKDDGWWFWSDWD